MCQYGAYGFAQHGRTYRQILAHYYQGSEIGKAPSSNVRVLLQSGRRAIAFRGATRASGGVKLRASKTYRAVRSGSRVELRTSGGQRVGRFSAPLIVTSRPDVTRLRGTAISGKRDGRYRGLIAIWPSGAGGVSAVNHASIDDYVKGVVPGEMPPTWHVEAVKSQAVAARSYALATKKPGATFDLYPDTRSQVYRGYDGEHANANQAVDRTAREVVTHDGKVAVTYFFSTSGGETENVENVFYGARPTSYLRGVDDPYDDISPRHRWRFEFTSGQMQSRLRGLVKGSFRGIDVTRRGVSPRVVSAEVVGSGGRTRVSGATLRSRLGLYDTWASFETVNSRVSAAAGGRSQRRRGAPREIYGSVFPAPRGGLITIERRDGKRWRPIRLAPISAAGDYGVTVQEAGVYRVRADGVTGPSVRVG
jgi:stage II sporulation protein D